ncbi:MAG: hypothetical protein ACM3XN_07715 [Chloroflexota bacterium]
MLKPDASFRRDDRVVHKDSGKIGRVLGIAPRGGIALVKWDRTPKLHDVPTEHLLHYDDQA